MLLGVSHLRSCGGVGSNGVCVAVWTCDFRDTALHCWRAGRLKYGACWMGTCGRRLCLWLTHIPQFARESSFDVLYLPELIHQHHLCQVAASKRVCKLASAFEVRDAGVVAWVDGLHARMDAWMDGWMDG
eukprot:351809-Chlamydomonas_euryale.AAC.7